MTNMRRVAWCLLCWRLVSGSPAPSLPALGMPFWTAPKPDSAKPLFGYKKFHDTSDAAIYLPNSTEDGWYNHAAMITYFKGVLITSWKNAPHSEDTPGQRVLYSRSSDGMHWSKAEVLFPNMSTASVLGGVAQFAGPFAVLNGRLYASATPAIRADGDAQGAQFCLWPDGLDPRNCASPDHPGTQPKGLLMMRRILPGLDGGLGKVFWAYDDPPKELAEAASLNGVKKLSDMDDETRADIAKLMSGGASDEFELPCDVSGNAGTLKCEACKGGCQIYKSAGTKGQGMANERAHYSVPGSAEDVILFRSHSGTLWASRRIDGSTQSNWSAIAETSIPNDNSNLNAGMLPNDRGVFLVSNIAKANIRDPLTVSMSADGKNFSSCQVVQTCTDLLGGHSTCKARQKANRNVGPSYPQGLSVVAPAPEAIQGLYVVATNNKEDVIITRVPWKVLLAEKKLLLVV